MQTTSFRLPGDLLGALDRAAKRRGLSKSTVVRKALEAYLAGPASAGRFVTLLDSLVDYEGSGVGNLAAESERHLRDRVRGRRHRPR